MNRSLEVHDEGKNDGGIRSSAEKRSYEDDLAKGGAVLPGQGGQREEQSKGAGQGEIASEKPPESSHVHVEIRRPPISLSFATAPPSLLYASATAPDGRCTRYAILQRFSRNSSTSCRSRC